MSTFFARLVFYFLPDKEEETRLIPAVWHLQNSALHTPSMALSFARAEMARMNKILNRMLIGTIPSFMGTASAYDAVFPNLPTLRAIKMREEKIDFLEAQVTVYLFKIVEQPLSDRESKEAFALMEIVKVQEAIGDVIEMKLLKLLAEKKAMKVDLTAEGKKEINELYFYILQEIELLTDALQEMEPQKASVLLGGEERFCQLERDVEFRHLERITKKIPINHRKHTSKRRLKRYASYAVWPQRFLSFLPEPLGNKALQLTAKGHDN